MGNFNFFLNGDFVSSGSGDRLFLARRLLSDLTVFWLSWLSAVVSCDGTSLSSTSFWAVSNTTLRNPTLLPKLHSCLNAISSQNSFMLLTPFHPCSSSSSINLDFGSSSKCGMHSLTGFSGCA
ncbi:hypothetical protein ABW19_dt0205037 [Dactylella cylindrospora]|nr:hypothetical protein ABW19_dt0205037 [Dactylella cylindrospora]